MTLASIRNIFRIRRLVKNGLEIGRNVYIGEGVSIDSCFCWLISIGNDCILGDGVVILAHDASTKIHLKYMRIGKVKIGDRTFIGANSIILPGVKIGADVIIGAGAVVTHDVPDGTVAVGNPARIIKQTVEYIKSHESKLKNRWTSRKTKKEIAELLEKDVGYVE